MNEKNTNKKEDKGDNLVANFSNHRNLIKTKVNNVTSAHKVMLSHVTCFLEINTIIDHHVSSSGDHVTLYKIRVLQLGHDHNGTKEMNRMDLLEVASLRDSCSSERSQVSNSQASCCCWRCLSELSRSGLIEAAENSRANKHHHRTLLGKKTRQKTWIE